MKKPLLFFLLKSATSHIDDKYGVDVDELYELSDVLPEVMKKKYTISLTPADAGIEDIMHLGYMQLHKL
ncbi:MAG: hypothetical protein ACR2KB_02575 [Chitinophagaceae bacterium]